MESRATITALLVTYNAERFMRVCLESLKWADEIVVVDWFSKDNTVKIAKEYTDKIYIEKETLHAKRANIGIEKSTSDWILKANATEVITEPLKNEILEAINKENNFVGYYIPRLNYFWGKLIPERPGTLFLFKRGAGKFRSYGVHERTMLKGKIGYLNNFKVHWGGHITIEEGINKTNQATSSDAREAFFGKPDAFFWGRPIYKANIFNLIYRPIVGFFSLYFLGGFYRYGMHGFIISMHHAFNFFLEVAKLYELQYKHEHHIDDKLIPPSLDKQQEFIERFYKKKV